jgi:hypothetical protein
MMILGMLPFESPHAFSLSSNPNLRGDEANATTKAEAKNPAEA